MRAALAPLYRLFEFAGGFALQQKLGQPTTDRYRRLIRERIAPRADAAILDLGCGIDSFRGDFPGPYIGIDINPAYVEEARATQKGRFEAMDCTTLVFPDASFDEVVSIATLHHLSDAQIARMMAEALRVCRPGGAFHIIDAILPIRPNPFKWALFRLDRGDHPRTLAQHLAVVGRAGRVLAHATLAGPLHDTVYVRVERTARD